MLLDGGLYIGRTAVMKEEDTLADTPQRCGAELTSRRGALGNSVGETRAHIVQSKIAQRLERDIGCGGANLGVARGLADHVAGLASDIGKDLLTLSDRSGRSGRRRRTRRYRGCR